MSRWFVLPRLGSGAGEDPYRPDKKGLDLTHVGIWMDFSSSDYSDLPWHPDPMFVVRVYGDAVDLDELATHSDCYGKQEYDISDAEVAAYLNDIRGESFSFDEWTSRILSNA